MVSLRTANSNVKEENAGHCENLQFSVENRKLCRDNFVLAGHTATIKEENQQTFTVLMFQC